MKNWNDPLIVAELALSSPTAFRFEYWTGAGGVDQIIVGRGWRLKAFVAAQRVGSLLKMLVKEST